MKPEQKSMDEDKTKEQLVDELVRTRRRVADLERSEAECKQMEEELRRREEEYRLLYGSMIEGVGVHEVIYDESGRPVDYVILDVNPAYEAITGWTREEAVGRRVSELYGKENQSRLEIYARVAETSVPADFETTFEPTQKSFKISVFSPERGKFATAFEDITQWVQAEKALRESEKRLRSLSANLLAAQETERKRVSRELHDELGQALTFLKIQIKSIERDLIEKDVSTRKKCTETLEYIGRTIENVRRLSRDLSPSVLEHFGLSAAIRRLTEEFEKHFDVETSLRLEEIDNIFSQNEQIIIYRIVQEALTNVGRHAHATRAQINIKKQAKRVSFHIEENGVGFDVSQFSLKDTSDKQIGLAAMRERALMLGGDLHVISRNGGGTEIVFTAPINERG
jgi:PAS domain S-box-containing protein